MLAQKIMTKVSRRKFENYIMQPTVINQFVIVIEWAICLNENFSNFRLKTSVVIF